MITDGILAQVVEHLTFNQVVRGSNPRCLMKAPEGDRDSPDPALIVTTK